MKIIHMIDDYRRIMAAGRPVFEAYTEYTEKYPALYEGIFGFLYHLPLQALKPMIDRMDPAAILKTAKENYACGICEYITKVCEKTASALGIDFDFELLLGVDLGNIGGCGVPQSDGVPRLFVGIDRNVTRESIDMLVPHEMFHMMHLHLAGTVTNETVMDRAAEEGIASYMPMHLLGMEWREEDIIAAMLTSKDNALKLTANTDAIVNELLQRGEESLDSSTMTEFFTAASENEYPLKGYYAGLWLVHNAVDNGFDISRFYSMNIKEIGKTLTKLYR